MRFDIIQVARGTKEKDFGTEVIKQGYDVCLRIAKHNEDKIKNHLKSILSFSDYISLEMDLDKLFKKNIGKPDFFICNTRRKKYYLVEFKSYNDVITSPQLRWFSKHGNTFKLAFGVCIF